MLNKELFTKGEEKDSIYTELEVMENHFHRQVAENLPRGMKYLLSVGVIIVH